jgi:menaquinone-9 beta-reductase
LELASVRAAGGPGMLAAHILAEVGWPAIDRLDKADWRGTPTLTRRAAQLADERLLVLGDAAGYIEPFTGEGIAWAVSAGLAVAPLALRGIACWDSQIEDEWSDVYRRKILQRQGICRRVAWGLRHPTLVRTAIKLLSRHPRLAQPIINRLNKH